jgi:hypothetical protein
MITVRVRFASSLLTQARITLNTYDDDHPSFKWFGAQIVQL